MSINVYSYIESYYALESDLDILLPKDILTEFLQHQAWSGLKDDELRFVWRDIYAYILANLNTGQTVFQNRSPKDGKNILAWLRDYALDFNMNAKNLHRFLNTVQNLHEYLLEIRYINHIYFDFRSIYNECIDKKGNIKILSSAKDGDNVLYIDFMGKTLTPQEFKSFSMVSYRQPIYIREHLIDFTGHVFDAILDNNNQYDSEKLFDYYTIYWNRYVEAKLIDVVYDAELLENFSLNDPNNIIGFAEYLVFGTAFEAANNQVIDKVLSAHKNNIGFTRFLEYYRNSQIRFFKIISTPDEPTRIKDIVTNECFTLDEIDIANYGDNEIFIAYFNKQNKLLPTATISIDLDDMQLLAFQDVLKKMTHYMLGEQATINDFLIKHDLLARHLFVSSALNKRIGLLFRQVVQSQKPVLNNYHTMRSTFTDFLEKNISTIASSLYFNEQEKHAFSKLWQDIYVNLDDHLDFADNLHFYFVGSLKIFLELNHPDKMDLRAKALLKQDEKNIKKYANKIKTLLHWKYNHLRYRTELGMISFIDSLIDKE